MAIIKDTAERTWAAVERARSEAALRHSEERAAFVRRASGVGFWYCDLPFDVLQWDDLVKAHFHLPPDALVTIQTFYDRIDPDDRERTRLAIDQSILGKTNYGVDYRTVDPATGATSWVRAIGRTFYAPDGTPIRFDGVTLDLAKKHPIWTGLQVLDVAMDGHVETDPDFERRGTGGDRAAHCCHSRDGARRPGRGQRELRGPGHTGRPAVEPVPRGDTWMVT